MPPTSPTSPRRIHRETGEFSETTTAFDLFFKHKDHLAGFSFPCDEEGNILFEEVAPEGVENARKCAAGEMEDHLPGVIRKWTTTRELCSCGSGETPQDIYDARGIYVTKACSRCEKQKTAGYRREIFENPHYAADEPIEEEA
jgi:hypothetical protein